MKDEDFISNMNGASVFTVGLHDTINAKKTDYGYQVEMCTGNQFFSLWGKRPWLDGKEFLPSNSFLITLFCFLEQIKLRLFLTQVRHWSSFNQKWRNCFKELIIKGTELCSKWPREQHSAQWSHHYHHVLCHSSTAEAVSFNFLFGLKDMQCRREIRSTGVEKFEGIFFFFFFF